MTRKVNVQYRVATINQGDIKNITLEGMLLAAWDSRINGTALSSDANLRRQNDATSYGDLVLNHLFKIKPGVFVEIVRFETDSRIPLIQTATGGQEFSLQNATTPSGSDLIKGTFYAFIMDDNVFMVERDFSIAAVEMYLNFLLGSCSGVVSADISCHLVPKPGQTTLPTAQRLVVKPKLAASNAPKSGVTDKQPEAVGIASGLDALDILKAAHFAAPTIARLQERGVDIEVKVEVAFKGDRKKTEIARSDIMDLTRHVTEDEIVLFSEAGRERNGSIRRLVHTVEVETVGSLFERASMANGLKDAYQYFLKSGFLQS